MLGVRLLTTADLPATFRAADAWSLAGQRAAVRWRAAQLLLLLAAAAAGAVSFQITERFDIATLTACGAYAAALICERARAARNPEREWYRGRAGAESVKTLAWKYAVGGEPFGLTPREPHTGTVPNPDAAAAAVFLESLRGVTASLDDVDWIAGGESPAQITPGMRDLRRSPLPVRRDAYREARIAHQRGWYAGKAAGARRNARRWSVVVTVATSIGLIGATVKAFGGLGLDFLGIASACAASAAAWTQFRQHESIASAYGVAARELTLIDDRLAICDHEATWARLVEESEAAISREHTTWAARRDVRLGRQP